ncbi:MAG: AbrB family transcriptional regulator [Armatimonadota bacterium]|nr:AbrB family transcriptional regulator [Armatimonadota bacterium]MDR7402031.1 AbrB family transcriptional regulator [Armatimonadota bacterium]MDR7437992.1 AbrB family transcriptional regulator [Armatimonadota bacterium]MDR7473074.1 AbrB family transcriptional regulator [Armatimonadota bacterium]MDR7507402.1 AbrB family transcriptional regulator [Armatimonadota bacterium]
MTGPLGVAVVLAVGTAGGYVALRLRLPAGALLGSLLAVLAAHALIPGLPALDPQIRRGIQILVGTALGSRISPQTLHRLRRVLPAVAVVVAATVAGTLGGALLVAGLLRVDMGTALLASTPGGMPEMILMADALHRDVPLVTVIQLVRVLLTLIVLVPLARLVTARQGGELT